MVLKDAQNVTYVKIFDKVLSALSNREYIEYIDTMIEAKDNLITVTGRTRTKRNHPRH